MCCHREYGYRPYQQNRPDGLKGWPVMNVLASQIGNAEQQATARIARPERLYFMTRFTDGNN